VIVDRSQKLFLVVNPQRIKTHPPTFIHEARDTAILEAERLARENPGETFHVCESTIAKAKVEISTYQFDPDQDHAEIPF
jgi:hypothetical protein